jgi:translation initiation factor 2B subunit (eIF-2B alpha/beta/delta family)
LISNSVSDGTVFCAIQKTKNDISEMKELLKLVAAQKNYKRSSNFISSSKDDTSSINDVEVLSVSPYNMIEIVSNNCGNEITNYVPFPRDHADGDVLTDLTDLFSLII